MTIIKLARALADLDPESYKQTLAFARELNGRKPGRKAKVKRAKRAKPAAAPVRKQRRRAEPEPAGVVGE